MSMVHQRRVVFTLHGCLLVTGTHNFGASCACRATTQLARTRFHSAAAQETRAGAVASQARCCCTHVYVCLCVHVRLHMCVYAYIRTCENVCVFVLRRTSGIPLHVCLLGCVCGPEGHVCMHVSAGIQTYVHAQMGGWVGSTICTRSVRMYVKICGHS